MDVLCTYDTEKRPYVYGDHERIEIQGRCLLDADTKFWNKLLNWVQTNKWMFKDILIVETFIDYANSISHRFLLSLIYELNTLPVKVVFVWKYESDDMDVLELGQDLEFFSNFKFNYVEVDVYRAHQKCKIHTQFPEIFQTINTDFV